MGLLASRPQAHCLRRGKRRPEILKIDKNVDDTIRQAFKNAKAAGIETIGFFIIGLPGDTRETMQKTIDFAIELDPMIANFSMMTPYPARSYEL
jgi:radical SAM superfamily enzyme YgiQ (UPF0313 family)